MTPLNRLVLASTQRIALPIAVHPGARLVGCTVRQVATDPHAQARASRAIRERLGLPVALAAMDLSVEAEAFGAEVRVVEDEVPTVVGRRIADVSQIALLAVPEVGVARTGVAIETVRLLAEHSGAPVILGSLIGPFSLAGRLFGVAECLELTLEDPDATHALVEKATAFQIAYARAQKAAGAHGVVMAEPSAGLLSPGGLASFSSAYVRRIVEALDDERFGVLLHNCGARLAHLPAVLEAGARTYHFGAPMDLPAAAAQAPSDVVLCGNLDPSAVFVSLSSQEVATRTRELAAALAPYRNVVLSSGCDVPPTAPIENLDAFVHAATTV
jgi:uroporphyrinogen decarboxylase